MTPADYVTEKAGANETPALGPDQVEACVDRAARHDAAGVPPYAEGWQPTYDLNAAVADALESRAALVLTRFDLTVDGQTLRREQMHKALLDAARMWRARTVGRVRRDAPTVDPRFRILSR